MFSEFNLNEKINVFLFKLKKKSPKIKIGEERYLSYLPLAHMLERVSQVS